MKAFETKLLDTSADQEIRRCLESKTSFSVIAGAGSGKTTSLKIALNYLREKEGSRLRRDDMQIACLTYTNRAVQVISNDLDWDELFHISTLHSFLWNQAKRFTDDIRETLREHVIPSHICKKQEDDNGGNSRTAIDAREKIKSLQEDLNALDSVKSFNYQDTRFSDYQDGRLNHDDIIALVSHILTENRLFRQIVGQKYPYIFVDEAQDTFPSIITAFNKLCENDGLPLVGYFGDPMQQIYDKRAGTFSGPEGSEVIKKRENFRCSSQVIDLLNNFRKDVEQFPAGDNKHVKGSVLLTLVQAEIPSGKRKRYTSEQLERAAELFSDVMQKWEWSKREDIIQLFLARQMIARRLGFSELNLLFTGEFASSRAQEDYEKGEHFLLVPFVKFLCPLVRAYSNGSIRQVINLLRTDSPIFDPEGEKATLSLTEIRQDIDILMKQLIQLWEEDNIHGIIHFCHAKNLLSFSDRFLNHFQRDPRMEQYDRDIHSDDKGDWLADAFFTMRTTEIDAYANFIDENTPFSTQHGVKGEQYKDVVIVFDDTEAAWNNYSFTKALTPSTSGNPTSGQLDRSQKLAYVCFSRAQENLRIMLFTLHPHEAKKELISKEIFTESQIQIVE